MTRFFIEVEGEHSAAQADLICLAIQSRLTAMGHKATVTPEEVPATPAFRRGAAAGSPEAQRPHHGTTEWQHAACSDGSTPVIDARYAGTCCSCLGRIEEGDEICAYE